MHNVDIRNISLGQMLYFVKTAEYKNITRASQYFNLSQPTLSKKLKSLEAQLDLQLFIRTGNTVSLTPAGKHLCEVWTYRLQGLEEEIQYAHILQKGHSKNIVAACLDSFKPDMFFLPVVDGFMEEHPDVHIRIESDSAQDVRRMLVNREADVIFSIYYDFEEKEAHEIEWRKLGKTPNCACIKKTNPLAQKEILSMNDLRHADFVCISPQFLPEYSRMIHAMCAKFGYAPNISKYVSSANSLTLNIRSNNDVFICDKYYSDLNSEEHVLVPIEDTESGFIVAWRKDSNKPYLEDFVDEVLLRYE